MFARQGDIRREGAPPATSEDLGGHSEQFAASEFFNVEVVELFVEAGQFGFVASVRRIVGKLFVKAEQFVVSEFFNVKVAQLFVEAGQFGFVASVRRVVGKLFTKAEQFVVSEFFNVKVVELFVEAGQFGFVASRFVASWGSCSSRRSSSSCQSSSCLLYTSPSPRDRTRSRMPSSA